MNRLLLVTDKPEVLSAFGGITNWERLGFRPPRTASSAAEAVDVLSRHHADGIAIDLPREEADRLIAFLNDRYPLTPIMRASSDRDLVERDVSELEQLLGRVHADYSNDPYSEAEMMQRIRHAYFRRVLSGSEPDPQRVRRYMRLLRSKMDPNRPCMVLELALPAQDGYLDEHWRYGADRLEVALRNIFGADLQGMRVLISVLPDERIYLVSCPMVGQEAPSPDEMRRLVETHATEGIRHVKEYLSMDLRIVSRMALPTLTEFAREQSRLRQAAEESSGGAQA